MKIWYKTVAVIINWGLKEIIRNKSLSFFRYLQLEVANLAVNTIKAQGSQLERIDTINIFFVSFFTKKDFFFFTIFHITDIVYVAETAKNRKKFELNEFSV